MHKNALSARQRRFCAAILTAPTIEAAAQAAGIARRTAFVYLGKPHVRAAIRSSFDEVMKQAMRQAVNAMSAALLTLEDIHTDEDMPAGARVSAARAILENAARLSGDIDIIERIEALEQAHNGRE